MPLRHQNTKTHKEMAINILYLVSSLSHRLPCIEERLYRGAFACSLVKNDCTRVAKKTFLTDLKIHYSSFIN